MLERQTEGIDKAKAEAKYKGRKATARMKVLRSWRSFRQSGQWRRSFGRRAWEEVCPSGFGGGYFSTFDGLHRAFSVWVLTNRYVKPEPDEGDE